MGFSVNTKTLAVTNLTLNAQAYSITNVYPSGGWGAVSSSAKEFPSRMIDVSSTNGNRKVQFDSEEDPSTDSQGVWRNVVRIMETIGNEVRYAGFVTFSSRPVGTCRN